MPTVFLYPTLLFLTFHGHNFYLSKETIKFLTTKRAYKSIFISPMVLAMLLGIQQNYQEIPFGFN